MGTVTTPQMSEKPTGQRTFTREQRMALDLLACGHVRYGTRIEVMKQLRDMGLCYAHDNGAHLRKGRWIWRPTNEYRKVIVALASARAGERDAGG